MANRGIPKGLSRLGISNFEWPAQGRIKHYYNGSQRLASRIGGGFAPHPDLNHYDPLTDQVELPHSGYQHNVILPKTRQIVKLSELNKSNQSTNESNTKRMSGKINSQRADGVAP